MFILAREAVLNLAVIQILKLVEIYSLLCITLDFVHSGEMELGLILPLHVKHAILIILRILLVWLMEHVLVMASQVILLRVDVDLIHSVNLENNVRVEDVLINVRQSHAQSATNVSTVHVFLVANLATYTPVKLAVFALVTTQISLAVLIIFL